SVISRHLFDDRHPLAVASLVCPAATVEPLARRAILEFEHGHRDRSAIPNLAASHETETLNAALHASLLKAIRSARLDPPDLPHAPTADPGCLTYCPRCLRQYVLPEGVCSTCETPLVRFESAAATLKGEWCRSNDTNKAT